MLLVSAIPLVFSVVVVNQILKDTVALGFDKSVEESLSHSVDTHRRYIKARRRAVLLETRLLAHNPALREALSAGEKKKAQAKLEGWIERTSDDHMRAASIEITQVAGEGSERFGTLRVSSSAEIDKKEWRAKVMSARVSAPGEKRFELKITWVVPWALFREYEDLGQVERSFAQLEQSQGALSSVYTQTFMVFSFAMLAITFLAGFFWSRATTGRLRRLAKATALVGRGDLDIQVKVQGQDEIAALTEAFNRMVSELNSAALRLAYLERVSAWQEIARRLAHEIKNPLTPILLAVQQLDHKFEDYIHDPQRYRSLVSDSMEIVGEEVESLRTLVREFSNFARLPKVAPEPADAAAFLRDLVRTNPQFAPHVQGVTAPETVETSLDSTMMRRALINLIENAQQAIDDAGLDTPGSITLSVSDSGEAAIITIEDTGPGIDPAHLPRLFDPYFTTKSEGTGLGLAIVRKIILEHGGDISTESPLSQRGGARFTITLPRAS